MNIPRSIKSRFRVDHRRLFFTKWNFSVLTATLYNCLEEKFTDAGEETAKLYHHHHHPHHHHGVRLHL
jgi:hypothetical protein